MITHDIGTGIPLVLIHGFGVDSRIMRALEDTVDFTEYRRIYIDLPWTMRGLNTKVRSASDVLALLTHELQEYLPREPYAVIGNSFGALISRCLVHNDQNIVGLATLAGVFEPDTSARSVPPQTIIAHDAHALATLDEDLEDFTEISVHQDLPNFQRFQKYVAPGLKEANQQVLEAVASDYSIKPIPEEAVSEGYRKPSLHIFGRQDHVVGYQDGFRWLEHYQRGTFMVVDSAGHNVHLERPQLVKALIEDWLERIADDQKNIDFNEEMRHI